MTASSTYAQRRTQLLLGILSVGVWGLLLRPYLPFAVPNARAATEKGSVTFDTLSAQRINITDSNGRTRLIIANSARFPEVEVRGKVYPRSIHDTAGLLFFDTKGEETGGLVFTKLREDEVANLTFDYTFQPTDGIRMIKQESPDGTRWKAGFDIFDRRPYRLGDADSTQGIQRIALTDENQNAHLVISDVDGHPRIRIGVDKTGKPSIEMLGSDGKVTYRAGN
jgi:hypothetical protein